MSCNFHSWLHSFFECKENKEGRGFVILEQDTRPFPWAQVDFKPFLQEHPFETYFEHEHKYTDLYSLQQTPEITEGAFAEALRLFFADCGKNYFNYHGMYLSAQEYHSGDYLLCHDDQLEDRLFAFVIYVHELPWDAERGGQLDLFSMDHNGNPKAIAKSILPLRHTCAIFEVSPRSFHQVRENLSKDGAVRRSVGGWIRGTYIQRHEPREPFFNYIRSLSNDDSSNALSNDAGLLLDPMRRVSSIKGDGGTVVIYGNRCPQQYFYALAYRFDASCFWYGIQRCFSQQANYFFLSQNGTPRVNVATEVEIVSPDCFRLHSQASLSVLPGNHGILIVGILRYEPSPIGIQD
jgi:hypothetical protein